MPRTCRSPHSVDRCEFSVRSIVTDELRSYSVARRYLLPDVEHRQGRYLNITRGT
jgi:transposase-like protein